MAGAGLVLVVVSFVGLYVTQAPPVLDSSTPASQQGYRLIDVVRKPSSTFRPYDFPRPVSAAGAAGVNITLHTGAAASYGTVAGLWIRTPDPSITPVNRTDDYTPPLYTQYAPTSEPPGIKVTVATSTGYTGSINAAYYDGMNKPLLFILMCVRPLALAMGI